MIDKLWILKFIPIMAVPGNQVMAYFDTEAAARDISERHAVLISKKLHEEIDALTFDDLLGRHSMRVDFFPYCFMYELAPSEKSWKEINDKIRSIQQAVGTGNKDLGFKGDGKNARQEDALNTEKEEPLP